MRRSFYHYAQTLRNPNARQGVEDLANHLTADPQFPKLSEDYDEISDYLETNAYYVTNMDIFDELWRLYIENNQS